MLDEITRTMSPRDVLLGREHIRASKNSRGAETPFDRLILEQLSFLDDDRFRPRRQGATNFLFTRHEVRSIDTVTDTWKAATVYKLRKGVDERIHFKGLGDLKMNGSNIKASKDHSVALDCSSDDTTKRGPKKSTTKFVKG